MVEVEQTDTEIWDDAVIYFSNHISPRFNERCLSVWQSEEKIPRFLPEWDISCVKTNKRLTEKNRSSEIVVVDVSW